MPFVVPRENAVFLSHTTTTTRQSCKIKFTLQNQDLFKPTQLLNVTNVQGQIYGHQAISFSRKCSISFSYHDNDQAKLQNQVTPQQVENHNKCAQLSNLIHIEGHIDDYQVFCSSSRKCSISFSYHDNDQAKLQNQVNS